MSLFDAFSINEKLELKNRIMMPPVVTRLATTEGQVTDALKSYWQAVRLNRENLKAILKPSLCNFADCFRAHIERTALARHVAVGLEQECAPRA